MFAFIDAAPPDAANPPTKPLSAAFYQADNGHAAGPTQSVDPASLVAAQTLAQLGSPAIVFDEGCKVLFANEQTPALKNFIRIRAQNDLSFHDPIAQILFRKAAAEVVNNKDPQMRAFAARCSTGETTTIARVLPLRREPNTGSGRPRGVGILVFTPLTPLDGPSARLLRALFDLTPAEARVARGLAAGSTIEELACAARVSRNTVRSQVRGIMAKTGCRRQAEAVGLFCRVSIAGGSEEAECAARAGV